MNYQNKPIINGDVLVSTSGYSMTLVTFFKVLGSATKTGQTKWVQQIGKKTVSGETGYQGTCVPEEDNLLGQKFKARLSRDGTYIRIKRGGWNDGTATVWNGKPQFFNHMD